MNKVKVKAPSEYFIASCRGDNNDIVHTISNFRKYEVVLFKNDAYTTYQLNEYYEYAKLYSVDNLFNYIVSIKFHGDPFYVGVVCSDWNCLFVLVDKTTGFPYEVGNINASYKMHPDKVQKILNTRNEDRFLDEIFYTIDSSTTGKNLSIVRYLNYKNNIKDAVDIELSDKKNNIKLSDFTRVTRVGSGDFNHLSDDGFFKIGMPIRNALTLSDFLSDEQMFELISKYTKDFNVIPYQMDERIKALLYSVIAHTMAWPVLTIQLDDFPMRLIDKYSAHLEDTVIFDVDTMLFLYIMEFLKITVREKEFNKYLSLSNKIGLQHYMKGGYISFLKGMGAVVPTTSVVNLEKDKACYFDCKFAKINTPQYAVCKANGQNNVRHVSEHRYYFLNDLRVPVAHISGNVKHKEIVNRIMENSGNANKSLIKWMRRYNQKLLVNLPEAQEVNI